MVAANDLFVNAQILTPGTTSVTGLNNVGASAEAGEPSAGGRPTSSLWFAWFTDHARTSVQFDTIGSGWDTYLGFYTGPKPDGTQTFAQLANTRYDDDSGGNAASLIIVPSIPANTWCYLQYGGFGGASTVGQLNYPSPDQDWPGTVPTVSGRASAVGHLLGGTAPLIAAGVAGVATVKGVITRYKGTARLFPTSPALVSPGYRHNAVIHKNGSGAGPIYGPW